MIKTFLKINPTILRSHDSSIKLVKRFAITSTKHGLTIQNSSHKILEQPLELLEINSLILDVGTNCSNLFWNTLKLFYHIFICLYMYICIFRSLSFRMQLWYRQCVFVCQFFHEIRMNLKGVQLLSVKLIF